MNKAYSKLDKYLWLLYIYIIAECICMFAIRIMSNSSVAKIKYATCITYTACCIVGLWLMRKSVKIDKSSLNGVKTELTNDYIILWSGIHAYISMEYMSIGKLGRLLDVRVGWPVFVNIYIVLAIFWLIYLVTRKVMLTIHIGNVLFALWGIANHYLERFRGGMLTWDDFHHAASLSFDFIKTYDFCLDPQLIILLIDLLLWSTLFQLNDRQSLYYNKLPIVNDHIKLEKTNKRHKITVRMAISCTMIIVGITVYCFNDSFEPVKMYEKLYIPYNFIMSVFNTFQKPQEAYSITASCELLQTNEPSNIEFASSVDCVLYPNIIAIMNESFSDLQVLGDFSGSDNALSFLPSLTDNTKRGWLDVSVFGGGTSQTEYEFLTSDIISAFDGNNAYLHYFSYHDEYPSLVSVLESQGYTTCAFHCYLDKLYNRPAVYNAMGFDTVLFIDDVGELTKFGHYASDAANYNVIKDYFSNKEPCKPAFFFNVTMQNHGGYDYKEGDLPISISLPEGADFPQAENYLKLIKASDAALADLIQWFSDYDEPTIILLFGDHQPELEEDFYEYVVGKPRSEWTIEQTMQLYKTPFIIWHNYPCEGKDLGDVSPNYLAGILLDDAGLNMSNYQAYTLKQYEMLPVITLNVVRDIKGNLYPRGSDEYEELISDYSILTYNHTVDKENRVEGFNLSPK